LHTDHHVHVEEPGNRQDLGPSAGRTRLHRQAGQSRRADREDPVDGLNSRVSTMARAARIDLRTFQQELASRLAAKTAAQVESSRLGLLCAGMRWLIRLADAGEVVAPPHIVTVPMTRSWFLGVANVRGNLFSVIDFSA